VLWVRGGSVWIAHVGDSRAYLVREGQAHGLTQDHSLVAQLVQRGQLTAEQARTDPRRNVVTRSVGAAATIEVDAGALDQPLVAGDVLLLCSDGLHGLVGEDELAWYVADASLEKACSDLVTLANDRGGPDNISIVIARAVPGPAADEPRGLGGVIRRLFGGGN
jgi:protein phosphatase